MPNSNVFHPTSLNRFKYTSYLADAVVALIPEPRGDLTNVQLLSHPPHLNSRRIRDKRFKVTAQFKRKLEALYKKDTKILQRRPSVLNSNNNQPKYDFTKEFKAPILNFVEVTCRIITNDFGGKGYNLSRIGTIMFKGEMRDIISDLQERCQKELNEKYVETVVGAYPSAAYVREHKCICCPWQCREIQLAAKHEYPDYFKEYHHQNPICFHKRQLLGQGLVPYIAEPVEENNDDGDDDNESEVFIFDNMFEDRDGDLAGIKKDVINYDPNFLTIVDRDACTALMTVSLDYVGISGNNLTIYFSCNNSKVIYCTNSLRCNDIQSASDYLDQTCYTNKKLQNHLEQHHKIPKRVFEFDDDSDFCDEQIRKKPKNDDESEKKNVPSEDKQTAKKVQLAREEDDDDEDDSRDKEEEDEEEEEEEEEEKEESKKIDEDYNQRRLRILQDL